MRFKRGQGIDIRQIWVVMFPLLSALHCRRAAALQQVEKDRAANRTIRNTLPKNRRSNEQNATRHHLIKSPI